MQPGNQPPPPIWPHQNIVCSRRRRRLGEGNHGPVQPNDRLRVDCSQERIILLVCIQVKRGQGKLGIGLMWFDVIDTRFVYRFLGGVAVSVCI